MRIVKEILIINSFKSLAVYNKENMEMSVMDKGIVYEYEEGMELEEEGDIEKSPREIRRKSLKLDMEMETIDEEKIDTESVNKSMNE